MEETILRSDAMAQINRGQPFDLDIVTADRRRGTGGRYLRLRGWMRLRDNMPAEARPAHYTPKHQPKKDSRHHENKTFLAFNPANRTAHPVPVHYRLMQYFNGKKILNG